jgi:hypothetical protein
VTACLATIAGWLLLGGAPTAFVRPDSSGEFYHVVELTPIQLFFVLARYLVHDAFEGALLGLLGGTIPAFISSLYWKRIGGLKQTAIMSGIFGILLVEWNLPEADLPDFRMVTGFGTTGAVFGLLLVLVARLLCILLEAWERGRHEGRAVFPAWLRLLIYLPCAAMLYLVGIVLASDLAAAYVAPGPEGQATAMGPGALTFAVYVDFPLVVLFTLWFARQYDRRTWREIGLTLTPRTPRELLLGGVLGGMGIVLVGAYALMGLV